MNQLEIQRQKIDRIDKQLLPLFLERMECTKAVAEYKRQNNMPVLDQKRENEILETKAAMTTPENATAVRSFFSSIMSISRDQQRRLLQNADIPASFSDAEQPKECPTVVFQGVAGANSETALIKLYGNNCKSVNVMTFSEVLDTVEKGDADYGILPLENSGTGSIPGVYEMLQSRDFYIIGEADIPIEHCLVALPNAELSNIKTVYSHEQGYLQCKDFFKNYPQIEFKAFYNTALAAKLISGMGDISTAAISDPRCAEIYGLQILARNISTGKNNVTRFAAVAKKPILTPECNKISIIFTLANEVGSLNRVLSEFAMNNLNMLKIESRPAHSKNFEYMFFADIEGNLLDPNVQKVINAVSEHTSSMRILGSYPLKK